MILLFSALWACDGGDAPADPTPTPEKQSKKGKAKAEVPIADPDDPFSGLEGFDRARSLTASRNHRDALGELEGLLSTASDDERVWRLLRFEASTAGESSALLDRLDANTALGGQDLHHQMLRASLALDSDRPDDALDAAQKLTRADAELGAVYTARALLAGATHDTSALSDADPNEALVLAAVETNETRIDTLLEASDPKSWQGLVLRAEIRERTGDPVSALGDLTAVLESEDLEASVRAAPLAARLMGDRAVAASQLADAARSAEELGLSEHACALGANAVTNWLSVGHADDAEAFALERHAAREEAKDSLGTAQASLAVADAALAMGHAASALEHAATAHSALKESDDAWLAEKAAWYQVQAAYTLGLAGEVSAAAESVPDQHADVATALASVLTGAGADAVETLAASEHVGAEGVRIQLAGARAAAASGGDPAPFTSRAVGLATAEGVPATVLLEALLEQERFARQVGAETDALATLAGIAAEMESSGPLSAEIIVRHALNGVTVAEDDPLRASAELGPWAALLADNVAAEGEGPLTSMARGRALAAENRLDDSEAAYHDAWSALPSHHRGPWSPMSVQTGAAGVDIATDAALLADSPNPKAALALLAAHDWWHAARAIDAAFEIGDDPSAGLAAADRISYNDAHSTLRIQTVRWLAGVAPEPVELRDALETADVNARSTKAFDRALSPALPDYATVQSELKGMAILSYRLGPDGGEAVAVTPDDARAVVLDDVGAIEKAAVSLLAEYEQTGAGASSEAAGELGNDLRVLLVEPFHDELAGTGRYIVLPDGPLWGVSLNVLPEQHSSMRYLADIRTIGYGVTVADAWRTTPEPLGKYNPEYLGFSGLSADDALTEEGLKIPTETENSGRHFDEAARFVRAGEEASAEDFLAQAPKARMIHLADIGEGGSGSLALGSGEVVLADVRGLDLHGHTVIISSPADPRVASRWVQAFRSAGCASVITTSWETPLALRSKFVYTFYESLIQHGSPARALLQARQALREEMDLNGLGADPGWWGPYFLHGQP
ncbi:MAG: CHAT domain-containing protein [Proteobacteria bacterium]|nr:CHAT domain-containing protein [Pseudomonadota bacterium]MCP4920725.1 CHAT domain-containing protein [Pseudomonadota bacterium]